MNYDFSKCNNLRWEYRHYKGYIKTDGKNIALLLDDAKIDTCGIPRPLVLHYTHISAINGALESPDDFHIIPRNPQTYNDWQVDDKVKITGELVDTVATVGARTGNIVMCHNSLGYLGTYTCMELANLGELILTDYEKTLIAPTQFRQGDKVLVRDTLDREWEFGIFDRYEVEGYVVDQCEWKHCIPYNEKTWQLLGTKKDYKEDDRDND